MATFIHITMSKPFSGTEVKSWRFTVSSPSKNTRLSGYWSTSVNKCLILIISGVSILKLYFKISFLKDSLMQDSADETQKALTLQVGHVYFQTKSSKKKKKLGVR